MLQKYLDKKEIGVYLFIGGTFVLFLFLRVIAWKNTVLFEDYDSLGYLEVMKVILQGDIAGIRSLKPEYTPGYGFWGAFFSLPGWGVEIGARLTSLFFGGLCFLALLGIGKHVGWSWGVAFGLFLVSINPTLLSNSIAVLSEPTYVGLVYLGLWLFLQQRKAPGVGSAVFLGIIFGFVFLTRTEGILFLLFIPFLQIVATYWSGKNILPLKSLVVWCFIYILGFAMLAGPQIWRVSEKMGSLAINGRQNWMAVLNNPDGKSYKEKIHGLDFSPSEVNIVYLGSHSDELKSAENMNIYIPISKAIWNFSDLTQNRLGILLGPMCLIAFGFGLLSLYKSGYTFELFLFLAFLAESLVGPLLHNVAIRHILVIAPMMCLIAGIGIIYVTKVLVGTDRQYAAVFNLFPLIFLFGTATGWAVPIKQALNPPNYNREYSLAELREPIHILRNIADNELGRAPVVIAEKGYVAYFLGASRLPLPYSSYENLVKYCELNKVGFFYFVDKRIRESNFPFYKDFTSGRALADFTLLYSGVDAYGEKVELYRFKNK